MTKITRNNYTLQVLKPVDLETLKKIKSVKQDHNVMELIPTDIMRLEIGFGLIPLADSDLEDNLVKRIKILRKDIEDETGISIPSIHILDNCKYLAPFEYSFYIRGKEMVKYEIKQNKFLCIASGKVKKIANAKEIKDPVFDCPVILINKNQIKEANNAGYITIVDAPAIIMTHLGYLIKENISEVFTYDISKNILKNVQDKNPLLVKDCLSEYRPVKIKKILSIILEKRKNLLNIDRILEMLLYYSKEKDIEKIAELIIELEK